MFGLRLAAGVGQGLALTLLYYAAEAGVWPATTPPLFAALALMVLFVPVLGISGLGHVRPLRLGIWLLLAALVSALVGWHAMARLAEPLSAQTGLRLGWWALTPSGPVLWLAALGFFMAQALVLAGASSASFSSSSHRFWRPAPYSAYFEAAWKLALQVLLALLFVGVLWLILWLGSALFLLLGLKGLRTLLEKPWFYLAVTASAFSLTLHVSDVRPAILASIRTLLLGLMAWLLPLAVALAGGFLLMLPLTGLTPLWGTQHAGSALLGAAVALVVLANTVLQDGRAQMGEGTKPALLRWSLRAACLLLLPVAALAAAALTLRVQQYGWTGNRVMAGAVVAVTAVYGVGYFWAGIARAQLAARMAAVNLGAVVLALALLLALSTPLADPARLGVQHQLARLASGAVMPKAFDYDYLRFEGERYGLAALQQLSQATGPDAAVLQDKAQAALRKPRRWEPGAPLTSVAQRAANFTVWPRSARLPASFLDQDWQETARRYPLPACLTTQQQVCAAYLMDLDGDGRAEIILQSRHESLPLAVFSAPQAPAQEKGQAGQRAGQEGKAREGEKESKQATPKAAQKADAPWEFIGTLSGAALTCDRLEEALAEGRYRLVSPRFQDLYVQGQRLSLLPWQEHGLSCQENGE